MATNIDELNIKITSNAKSATNSLDKLVDSITKLSNSIKSLDVNKFSAFTQSLGQLGTATQTLSSVKTSDFNKIPNLLQKLSTVDSSKITSIGSSLPSLISGIGQLGTANFNNKNLQSFINSLNRLSRVNISQLSSSNLANIGTSINALAQNLSTAPKVQQSVLSIVNSISKLAQASGNIPSVTSNLGSFGISLKGFVDTMSTSASVTSNTLAFTQSIASLANAGSKTVQTANGLSLLSSELAKFMQSMATVPNISPNIIQMTSALANLASQGRSIGIASRNIISAFNGISRSSIPLKKNILGLTGAFASFYAKYFLVMRGLKRFWSIIEKTTDLIESFNYYSVAMGKITSEWSKDFEKYGYENAEAYSESLTSRMDETLGKLSGIRIEIDAEGKGLLSVSESKNLGLNIQEITQYASQLASVMNSVGQTGEATVAASSAFTKLAGDISSLFNLDYSQVAANLQSGLIGQSRALYKYGIDITNATLRTYAHNLGLEKTVAEMTQAEKMQLRMIAILEQSKVAWGDLANTINTPANLIRQLKNNLNETGIVLGQLFIPMLEKVLPVLNGVSIALKNLLIDIANFLNIEINFQEFSQGYDDTIENLEEISGGLDSVTEAGEKAKKGLRGFDELNVIGSDAGLTVGQDSSVIDLTEQILAATSQYESIWNKAYEEMESRAEIFAEKVSRALEPIKDMFQNISIGEFSVAGADFSSFIVSINESLTSSIDSVDWEQVGANIGAFMEGINWTEVLSSFGKLFWEGINSSIDLWKGSFDTAPIETTILTSLLLLPIAIPIIDGLIGALDLLLIPFQALSGFVGGLSVPIIALGGAFLGLATGLGYVFATNEDVRKSFGEAVATIKENMQPVFEFVTDTVLPDLRKGFERLLEIFSPFAKFLEDTFTSVWQDILNPVLLYFGEKVIPVVSETLENLWNNILVPLGTFIGDRLVFEVQLLSDGLSFLWKNVVIPLAKAIGSVLSNADRKSVV